MDLGSTPSNESCRLIVWARPKDAGVCNDSYFLSNSSAREVVFSDRLQRGCPKTRNPGALVPQEAVRELLGDGEVARALVFFASVEEGSRWDGTLPARSAAELFMDILSTPGNESRSSSCGLDRRPREFTTTHRYFLSNCRGVPLRKYSWTWGPPRAMKVASSPCGLDRRTREFATTATF